MTAEIERLCERLRELRARATPGPWVVYSEPEVGLPPSLFAGHIGESGFGPVEPLSGIDVDLIAEAINALPTLLEALTRHPLRSGEGVERVIRDAIFMARDIPREGADALTLRNELAEETTRKVRAALTPTPGGSGKP